MSMKVHLDDADIDTDMGDGDDGGEDEYDDESPTQNTFVPPVQDPPPRRNPQKIIPANTFAGNYRSIFTLNDPGSKLLPLLKHVNCSYLSTPGIAPTILQLKQHAQSLVVLIKSLTVSTFPAVIDNVNSRVEGMPAFNDGETYDFLNDLTRPYLGPKRPEHQTHHNMPLTTLLNVLEEENIPGEDGKPDRIKLWDVCPLHHAEKTPINQPSLPYATHQNLISHANEALELLDHEYSAKGGLLSILPTKLEKEDREAAESTLLGQLILYIQHLVQRAHDLERCYANAMDVIAGEAVVPHQALSKLGPDGRQPREMVFPQDRFVLVNAGNDLYQFLNDEFEKKERTDEAVMANWKQLGLTGEAIWENRGGKEMNRGIVALDVTTRYYRLKGDALKTIFVIPAHQEHPGTSVTRELESKPTVVSVVKPTWPDRVSTWEMKHRADLEAFKTNQLELADLQSQVELMRENEAVLKYSWETAQGEAREWKRELEELRATLNEQPNKAKKRDFERVQEVNKLRQALDDAKSQTEKDRKAAAEEQKVAETLRKDSERRNLEHQQRIKKVEAEFDAEVQRDRVRIANKDAEIGQNAIELQEKLRAAWQTQIQETTIVTAYLNRKLAIIGTDEADEEVKLVAEKWASAIIDAAVPKSGIGLGRSSGSGRGSGSTGVKGNLKGGGSRSGAPSAATTTSKTDSSTTIDMGPASSDDELAFGTDAEFDEEFGI
ncbi:hypothetical protein LSUB1_G003295 [Lachnellula subtilissima]|uniref:Uncharacterized protein n=1 Tax=Lachnellula subtilissima TaxID=602034 RepID=A0A8H8RRG3_9HELO|nr:hypothetical protein LSUB1_G003295 [Lachnellula subtilissima]